MVLFALLVGMIGFVLWYVVDRRAKNRAALPGNPAERGVSGTNTGPAAAGSGAPVAGKTVPPATPPKKD